MLSTPHGGDLTAYADALGVEPDAILDFSANVNPMGLHPLIKEAIIKSLDNSHLYPDPACTALTAKLSEYHGLNAAFFVCGNGAADLIFRLVIGHKPRKALIVAPTFSEYQKALEAVDCEIHDYLLSSDDGFVLDQRILAHIDHTVDMLIICNPNNPTGIAYPRSLMLQIARHCCQCGTVLLVDECFNDFMVDAQDYTLLPYLEELPNLVILKAFTKMYATAGIRLGYCVCSDPMVREQIHSGGQHWSVSAPAIAAGVAALELGDYPHQTALSTATERERLSKVLKDLGLRVYEGAANYLFFYYDDPLLQQKLAKQNVIIRSCGNYHGLDRCYYRIGIKLPEQNTRLIEALKEVILSPPSQLY